MKLYTYYWSVNSLSGILRVSRDVDKVIGHSHDYHKIRAHNINEAYELAEKAKQSQYTTDGLPVNP